MKIFCNTIYWAILVTTVFLAGSGPLMPLTSLAAQPAQYPISSVTFVGLSRTNENWLREYIRVRPPDTLRDEDLAAIKRSILSTGVYSAAQTELRPTGSGTFELQITVKEQWTLIPVLRGGYGGGTPFSVLGVYDSHAFGRLWTIGAQAFRYGNAAPAGVVWAKAPRWLTGDYSLSLEAWHDRRRRDLFAAGGDRDSATQIENRGQRLRVLFLGPAFFWQPEMISRFLPFPIRIGLDASIIRARPSKWIEGGDPAGFAVPPLLQETSMDSQLLGQLEFDNISSFVSDMHGLRGVGQVGAYWRESVPSRVWRGEMFYFHLWEGGWNLAWHLEGVESQASHFDRLQFVGGLDAVRGFPDGYLNGPRSISMNTEMRYVGWKFDKVWLQAVVFQDLGWAGEAWDRASDQAISSLGTGLRVVLPGINRFVIRVDYGVSLSDPEVRGISAGLNQFFQPYKPLDAAP